MTPAEMNKYVHLLLDGVLEKLPLSDVLANLEPHFTAEQLDAQKVTAIGCVRVRNDISERMRVFRERPATQMLKLKD